MNVLTFDIEEWALYKGSRANLIADCDWYMDLILKKLDEVGVKATFFCTGAMAREYPRVVRLIAARGHEIGCHSNIHTWLNKMTVDECKEDTYAAVSSLEQCIGAKVLSYRAPAFSIGKNNSWAFEILASNGIERDTSIYPAERDFGGFANFRSKTPCLVECGGITIKEFPVCTTTFLGKEMAYSGGGYFRFFPLGFVQNKMRRAEYAMCYFHIGDLLPESNGVMSKEAYESYYKELGTLKARYLRYVKSNLGKKKAFDKMMKLIETIDFCSVVDADKVIDWNQSQLIKL